MGLTELETAAGFHVLPETERIIRAIQDLKAVTEPLVGVVLVDDHGRVTAPRAGLVGPERTVAASPGWLVASALEDAAAWATTFTLLPAGERPFTEERRELMRKLIYAALLLGLPVRDHLVTTVGEPGWSSLHSTSTWRQPRIPPLDEPVWPPFRRARQTARLVRHPHDERSWDERGGMPDWLRRLVDGVWSLDELREYI